MRDAASDAGPRPRGDQRHEYGEDHARRGDGRHQAAHPREVGELHPREVVARRLVFLDGGADGALVQQRAFGIAGEFGERRTAGSLRSVGVGRGCAFGMDGHERAREHVVEPVYLRTALRVQPVQAVVLVVGLVEQGALVA